MTRDFETPEGRLAALTALGPKDYAKALFAHEAATVVAVANGYRIREIGSMFGRLFAILGTTKAYSTLDQAKAFARTLPKGGARR